MSVCQFLHERLMRLPRFKAKYDPQEIPENGLYFVFERGEAAHDGERIVRVGTHTGQNNLSKRLKEHLYTMNKDRSIFRKHVGRCILTRRDDPFLETWDIDLTTRQARAKFEHVVDKKRLGEVEQEVSDYMNDNFSFVVLRVDDKADRLAAESGILSVIADCGGCRASDSWLGQYHPNAAIRGSGLWNIQGLNDAPITQAFAERLISAEAL
jgi:hypothetical protein